VSGILYLVVIGTTIWVGVDAHNLGVRRGRLGGGGLDMSVTSWVVCCLLLWIVAFPCYFIARGRYVALNQSSSAPWQASAGTHRPSGYSGYPASYASPPTTPYSRGPVAVSQPVVQNAWAQPVAAPPQLSPDGRWWWNGQQWLAAQPAPPVGPPV
jgi:hypothetical protein